MCHRTLLRVHLSFWKDIARETWEKSLMRNRSVIVNLFQGQLKSTHVCLDCKSVSRVFNPFMYLSLPLPIETTRWLTVHLVRLDPAVVIEKVSSQEFQGVHLSSLPNDALKNVCVRSTCL